MSTCLLRCVPLSRARYWLRHRWHFDSCQIWSDWLELLINSLSWIQRLIVQLFRRIYAITAMLSQGIGNAVSKFLRIHFDINTDIAYFAHAISIFCRQVSPKIPAEPTIVLDAMHNRTEFTTNSPRAQREKIQLDFLLDFQYFLILLLFFSFQSDAGCCCCSSASGSTIGLNYEQMQFY